MKFKLLFLLIAVVFTAGYRDQKHKEIEHQEAKYIKRKSDAWKEGGRLIGEVKNTPETFTIKVKNVGTNKVIYTYTHPARLTIYMTKRLPPGTYDLLVESEGYHPYPIRKVKIKARMDCLINLVFGTRVFHND